MMSLILISAMVSSPPVECLFETGGLQTSCQSAMAAARDGAHPGMQIAMFRAAAPWKKRACAGRVRDSVRKLTRGRVAAYRVAHRAVDATLGVHDGGKDERVREHQHDGGDADDPGCKFGHDCLLSCPCGERR